MGGVASSPGPTSGNRRVYIPRAGTITQAYVWGQFGTAGSNESWTMAIRINDTTDTTVASLGVSTSTRTWSNTGLSISVSAGDFFEIKSTNPTWSVQPANGIFDGVIFIQ